MIEGSPDREEVEYLFNQLRELTQHDDAAYNAVERLRKLYLSYLDGKLRYKSKDERGSSILKIAAAMMQINSFVSLYEHVSKYTVPLRELLQKFLDDND